VAEIRELRLTRVEELGALNIFSSITIFTLVFSLTLPIFQELSLPSRIENAKTYMQPYFIFSLINSLIAALLPMAVRTRQITSEINKLNESIIIMYDALSSYLRAGLTLIDSIDKISDKITSRILRHRLKVFVSLAMQGVSIGDALNKIIYGLPTRVAYALLAIIPISESGGKSPEIAILIRDFYDRLQAFDRLKKSTLSMYFYIMLISIIVYETSWLFLSRMYKEMLAGQTPLFQPVIGVSSFFFFSNMLMLVLIFFSSLIVSKIIRGTVKFFADYMTIFLVVHTVFLFIVSRNYLW